MGELNTVLKNKSNSSVVLILGVVGLIAAGIITFLKTNSEQSVSSDSVESMAMAEPTDSAMGSASVDSVVVSTPADSVATTASVEPVVVSEPATPPPRPTPKFSKVMKPAPSCDGLAVSGACLGQDFFSQLQTADYAFNAPSEMQASEPQTIALVLDTTGSTNFTTELNALSGTQVQGTTPTSLVMEAEIVGPAFDISPPGRQRRTLSKLNPTRWDWSVTPTRGGQHQLEVSLYVIATKDGKSIGEEKALADRQIITVDVSPLQRITGFISKLDPIIAFISAIFGSIAAVFAWFGIKSWRDVSKKEKSE